MRKRIIALTLGGVLFVACGFIFWQRGLNTDGLFPERNGEALGTATDRLISRLPADICFYPGANIKSFDEKMSGFQVVGEAGDNTAKVKEYFQQKLTELGWTKTGDATFRKEGRGEIKVTLIKQLSNPTVIILDYYLAP